MATVSFSIPVAEASSSTAAPVPRPVTSKARGVCKYYKDPRGCYAKDKCKFLHSEPPKEGDPPVLTPYDSSKTCRFYLQGYCKRGDKCWFRHTESKDKGKNPATLDEEDDLCSICFEKPITYGLLAGCNHVFCTTCIAQWRDPIKKSVSAIESGNIKRCPMCREPSRFITPSSRFWRHGTSEKNKTIETYRESMARVQCRYFQKSLAKDKNKPLCPYGKECFYQHKKEDGTLHEFKDGVEVSQRRYYAVHRTRSSGSTYDGFRIFEDFQGVDGFDLPLFEHLGMRIMASAVNTVFPPGPGGPTVPERLAAAMGEMREQINATSRDRNPTLRSVNGTSSNNNNPGTSRNERVRAEGRPNGPLHLWARHDSDEIFGITRLVDRMRTQLGVNEQTTPLLPTGPDSTRLPQAPPSTAGNRPRTTTRNGTAAVADADVESDEDEPPPNLVPDSDRHRASHPGHESDTSMPDLQAVSDSSDGEDVDDDESEWVDDESDDGRRDAGRLRSNGDFDGDPVAAFLRDIMGADLEGLPGFRPPTQNQAPQARPNRSARFSTVVDRSGSDRNTANRNGNRNTNGDANHGNGSAGTEPMRLMEWAEVLMRMDRELDSDEDASMPALEPVPRSRNRQADSDDDEPMPALEPIPLPRSTSPREDSDDEAMPALEPIPPPTAPLPVVSVATSSRSDQQDAPCAQPDPQPLTMGSGLMLSSANAPASQSLLSETGPVRAGAAEENAPGISIRKTERKTFNQQDFTTDGRGRVISIGGPEPSILVAPTAPEHSEIHAVSAEVVEEAQQLPKPAAIQRKSSEFTTDGRGRVISVGHSVSSGSSAMAESSALGESEPNTESVANRREEARDGDESGNGGGLLAWFGALF